MTTIAATRPQTTFPPSPVSDRVAASPIGLAGTFYGAATMDEEWKEFAGGNYEASNLGNVRRKTPGRKTWPGRPVKRHLMKIGYYMVGPTVNGKNVNTYVHVIIAELFLGPCPVGCEVNHIDGDKTNNVVTNLEYVTHQENMRHARRHGMIADRLTIPAETIQQVKDLRTSGLSYTKIVKETGVSISHCWSIVNNETRVRA